MEPLEYDMVPHVMELISRRGDRAQGKGRHNLHWIETPGCFRGSVLGVIIHTELLTNRQQAEMPKPRGWSRQ